MADQTLIRCKLDEDGEPVLRSFSLEDAATLDMARFAWPYRVPKASHRQSWRPVWAYMEKVRRLVYVESQAEARHLLAFDFDGSVTEAMSQPCLIEFGDGTKHVPDFVLNHRDGSVTIVDSRPRDRLEELAEVATRTRDVCDELGWRYAVMSDTDDIVMENVRLLAKHRHRQVPALPDALLEHGGRLHELILEAGRALGTDGALATASVLGAIWHGRLAFDITAPIDDETDLMPGASALPACIDVRAPANRWTAKRLLEVRSPPAAPGQPAVPPPASDQQPAGRPPEWFFDLDLFDKAYVNSLRARAEVINQAETGYRSGDPRRAQPDEPEDWCRPELPKSQRVTAACQRLGQQMAGAGKRGGRATPVTSSTYYRWRKALKLWGLPGLIDRRSVGRSDDLTKKWPAVFAACLVVLRGLVDDSDRPDGYICALVEELCDDSGIEVPRPATLRSIFRTAKDVRHHKGPTNRRRSVAAAESNTGVWETDVAGRFVQIDGTRLDVFCYDALFGRAYRPWLLLATCVASGAAIAFRILPDAPTIGELKLLLHDLAVDAGDERDRLVHGLPWVGLPETLIRVLPTPAPQVAVGAGSDGTASWRALAPIRAETFVVDNGSSETSYEFRRGCEMLGMEVLFARPGKGADKPHVERAILTISDGFCAWMQGYSGRRTHERGTAPEEDALPLDHVVGLLADYLTGVHNTRPRDYENKFGIRTLTATPAELILASFEAHGHVPLTLDRRTRIDLLTKGATGVGRGGFVHEGLQYNSAELQERTRGRTSPITTGPNRGKWPLRYGTADKSWVFVHDGDDWFGVPWVHLEKFGRAMSRRAARFGRLIMNSQGRKGTQAVRDELVDELSERMIHPGKDEIYTHKQRWSARLQAELASGELPPFTVTTTSAPSQNGNRRSPGSDAYTRPIAEVLARTGMDGA